MYSIPSKNYSGGPVAIAACSVRHADQGEHVAIAACAIDLLAAGDGKVPTSFRLFPAGYTKARDGRPHEVPSGYWFLDAEIAQRVLASAAARQDRFLFDYEHQTLHSEENGKPAPAAGWSDGAQMEWRDGPEAGIYIKNVEWTDIAAKAISNKEYRYISPVVAYNENTGELLAIYMATLTNYAAIDGLTDLAAVAAARFSFDKPTTEENDLVKREQLIKILGLKADATDADIEAALVALKANADGMVALRADLKLDEGADVKEAVAALKVQAEEKKPDPSKYAPLAVVEALKTKVATLESGINENAVDELIEQGFADGKLHKDQEEWARDLGKANVASLRAYLEKTPAIAALKTSQTQGKKPEGINEQGELTEEAMAMCKQMGIDPADYKKTLEAS